MAEEAAEVVAAKPVFNAVKINNPLWVGELAPIIQSYVERLKIQSITYETLYTYFTGIVQNGGNLAEFWVVFADKEPVAFACWYVRSLPYRGSVFFDHIYSWNRMSEPVGLLIDEYVKFGNRHNCPIYEGVATNEVVWNVHKRNADKKSINLNRTEQGFFSGRRK